MSETTTIRTGMPMIDLLFAMNKGYFDIMLNAGRSAPKPAPSRALVVQPDVSTDHEQVVAIGEEVLDVGVQKVPGETTRVRRTVKTVPIAKSVELKSETITIERRPARDNTDDALTEREYVMIDTREIPVITKNVRTREELVLRKVVTGHTETVRDTVRVSDVEVFQPQRAPKVVPQNDEHRRDKHNHH